MYLKLAAPLAAYDRIKEFVASAPPKDWLLPNAFHELIIPDQFLSDDPGLAKIQQAFGASLRVLRMMPNTQYIWHVDATRLGAINSLLSTGRSHSLFGSRGVDYRIINIVEIPYEPRACYLFDTKTSHSVTNFEEVRDVLSMSFRAKHVSFNVLRAYCQRNGMLQDSSAFINQKDTGP